jgi:DNA repair protein RadC
MKLKDYSTDSLPRERLINSGPSSLSTAELLAIILKSGTKKENIIEISNKLLKKYQLSGLSNATLNELKKEHGIGQAKASQIVAIFEILKRIPQEKTKLKITCAKDIFNYYHNSLSTYKKEHLIAIFLNSKNQLIKDKIITIGTINSSLIHPREIYHEAIKNLASSIIIMHNHPSGDPTPSKEDLEVTNIIKQTGQILQIKMLDHIIIGKNRYWSYVESQKHL